MPFRCRQKYNVQVGPSVMSVESVIVDGDTGYVTPVVTDVLSKELPAPELFDLEAQMKAGITQEEVKSTIMSSNNVTEDAVIRKYTKKSSKQEVSDEN